MAHHVHLTLNIALHFHAPDRTVACVSAYGGPWYFDNVSVTCTDGVALMCSGFAKLKCKHSMIGGLADANGKRAYIAMEVSGTALAQFFGCSIGKST